MSELSIYRVYVLMPLRFRERKHTVRIYRVGATSSKEAYDAVKEHLGEPIFSGNTDDWKIVQVERFSEPGSVQLAGSYTKTEEEAAQMKEWTP